MCVVGGMEGETRRGKEGGLYEPQLPTPTPYLSPLVRGLYAPIWEMGESLVSGGGDIGAVIGVVIGKWAKW